MNRVRKTISAAVLLTVVVTLGYLSKPDRGGVSRCSKVFDIPELNKFGLKHEPFLTWDLFESPKFGFEASDKSFNQLARELEHLGYSDWSAGGLTFGSVDVGWTADEDNIYCELTRDGLRYYWSYSAKKRRVWAITFPT